MAQNAELITFPGVAKRSIDEIIRHAREQVESSKKTRAQATKTREESRRLEGTLFIKRTPAKNDHGKNQESS